MDYNDGDLVMYRGMASTDASFRLVIPQLVEMVNTGTGPKYDGILMA